MDSDFNGANWKTAETELKELGSSVSLDQPFACCLHDPPLFCSRQRIPSLKVAPNGPERHDPGKGSRSVTDAMSRVGPC